MIKFDKESKRQLIELKRDKDISIEGGILKLIDYSSDEEFSEYIFDALEKDAESRKKRLGVNKKVQEQNRKLIASEKENEKINKDLKEALEKTEKAKEIALTDLEILQKKTQNELVGSIVKVSLWIICGVGIITSLLFAFCTFFGVENQVIQQAWSNMFSILLTNCFSIIGTIMGVKYASEKNKNKCCHK
jgi:hypothetical protein